LANNNFWNHIYRFGIIKSHIMIVEQLFFSVNQRSQSASNLLLFKIEAEERRPRRIPPRRDPRGR